jgi:hypothetical protein
MKVLICIFSLGHFPVPEPNKDSNPNNMIQDKFGSTRFENFYWRTNLVYLVSGITLNLSSNYDPANNPFEAAPPPPSSSNPFEADEEGGGNGDVTSSLSAPSSSQPFKGTVSRDKSCRS